MPTYILGKDAPLEETLARFQAVLSALGLDILIKETLNPLPELFSVRLEEATCPAIFSNGKGVSREAALCSAYGELIERLATCNLFAGYYLGKDVAADPYVYSPDEKWFPLPEESDGAEESGPHLPTGLLNSHLRDFYGKSGVHLDDLIDLGSASFERGVCTLPFKNARNGKTVYFPVNLLDNLYGSNGMSAGNTESEALVQALSEIIERYVKRLIIGKGIALPEIPDTIVERYPAAATTLRALNGGGLCTRAFDASLGGRFPVVCVVLFNQSNGTALASFGAHPILEVALERTLTELMQGRSFADLDALECPTFDTAACADITNLESHFVDSTGLIPLTMFRSRPDHRFVHWDFTGNTQNQYQALRYIVDRLGFEIYIRRYSHLGVPVVRVIAPGMSEIYPLDDLIYNNDSKAIDFQEALLTLPASDETAETYANYLSELEDNSADFPSEEPVKTLLGILPDPYSAWDTLRLGELKCLLALAAGDLANAISYATWTLNFCAGTFSLKRLAFYRCLIALLKTRLEKDLEPVLYEKALKDLYGEDTYSHALAHIEGRERFFGLSGSDLSLKGFELHQALITIFRKVRDFKSTGSEIAESVPAAPRETEENVL